MTNFYKAIVIDNKQFYIDGTIFVKIEMFNLDKPNDLSSPYNAEIFTKQESYGCLKAKVFSPMAGGRNYGIFYLPQINSKGIVANFAADPMDFIWLGSFFEVVDIVRENGETKYTINAPNNDIKVDDRDLISGGIKNSPDISEEAIIIRTKSTDSSTEEGLRWEELHTNNLIVIDKNKIEITRATGGFDEEGNLDKYQKFIIDEEDGKAVTKIEYIDSIKQINSSFKIEDGAIKSEYKKTIADKTITENFTLGLDNSDNPIFAVSIADEVNNISTSFKTNATDLVMSYVKDDKATFYLQDSSMVKITTNNATVSIKEEEIALDAKTVRIAATSQLILGNGNQYLVTTDSPLSGVKTQDGAILYFRKDKLV